RGRHVPDVRVRPPPPPSLARRHRRPHAPPVRPRPVGGRSPPGCPLCRCRPCVGCGPRSSAVRGACLSPVSLPVVTALCCWGSTGMSVAVQQEPGACDDVAVHTRSRFLHPRAQELPSPFGEALVE